MNVDAVTVDESTDDTSAWRALVAEASAPYRRAGRFAWHFARGKLRFDPVFAHVMRSGLVRSDERVLDIGCGQGLLASLVVAAGRSAEGGRWPSTWNAAPRRAHVTGIDISPREVERARAALGEHASFICGDMRDVALPASDVAFLLDAMHYVSKGDQDALLARVHTALVPGGRLVMRVADAAFATRGAFARAVDHVVAFMRRGRVVAQSTRSAAAWSDALRALGFAVESQPMGEGTPFANVLLVATLAATAPPRTLAHADIERLVPHKNPMCLLDRLVDWSATTITCRAVNHRDPAHPLRTRSGLLASATIEYAAQAMALHGALLGLESGRAPSPGFLASARNVVLSRPRLDDLPQAPGSDGADELTIAATRQAGDERQLLYAFTVTHSGVRVAAGRVAVVLNTLPDGATP